MRNVIINAMSNISAALVGWGPKAAKGLAVTQRAEPLRNIPANLWGWTHNEWDESALCAIADDPTLF